MNSEIPRQPSKSAIRRNPHLYGLAQEVSMHFHGQPVKVELPPKRIPQVKPLLNHTEQRCVNLLTSRGVFPIFKQAITLRLDPPFKRYTPDLAYDENGLVFVEVKGLHRFRRAGIAKAALAAKTYPDFRFMLFEWDGKKWDESVLSP